MTDHLTNDGLLDRYQASLLGVFGRPPLVLSHGSGCYVWDVEGNKYLDLVGGLAVSSLGHGHPALVSAISKQAGEALHVSNLFTSPGQIALAERLLDLSKAPDGSKVFFANSGAEAIEAAIKLSRRTGRTGIVAAEGAFHGRTTGALALTYKPAYREPFEPLIPGVSHVPYGNVDALRAAVSQETGAVVLEPIQGEAGVIAPDAGYLRAAREITTAAGALLIVDEIQSGIGRTGRWFGYEHEEVRPDAITLAKGLGGGVPIGALVTFGAAVSDLLTVGQHGSTFGGNPLAAAAGLAVLETIEEQELVGNAQRMGEYLTQQVTTLRHPLITGVRGAGLLRAITLAEPVSAQVAERARDRGIIINPVAPDALRLAPPLIIGTTEIDQFVGALPDLLEVA
ncbi:acetylornithine transaminase [Branchiibius sp. NY16-3462-2]|uniref:acetylornithine transaminase n=1 Tax=Branchiibius sp. NY16-3462-2 TaxID=1807500 RepID=UPI0007950C5B|nr:acetylornithine transaminase [Branchiibius sp. NY16-3462-2]KYH43619.1 acetylornithine aminotransferase [Branchiibius sp. NY16-3462-2]